MSRIDWILGFITTAEECRGARKSTGSEQVRGLRVAVERELNLSRLFALYRVFITHTVLTMTGDNHKARIVNPSFPCGKSATRRDDRAGRVETLRGTPADRINPPYSRENYSFISHCDPFRGIKA